MSIFNKYIRQILLLPFLAAAGTSIAVGQNSVQINQLTVPGTASNTATLPLPVSYTPTQTMRYVRTIVPKRRDGNAANYHIGTDPVFAGKEARFLDGGGNAVQSVDMAFTKNGSNFMDLYTVSERRTLADQQTYQPVPLGSGGAAPGYTPSLGYNSEQYYNNTSRFPSDANNMTQSPISISRVVNSSTAGERSTTAYAPGKSRVGQNRGTKTSVVFNENLPAQVLAYAEPMTYIRRWNIGSSGLPQSGAVYDDNMLKGTVSRNADTAIKWLFENKEGKPVMEAALLEYKRTPGWGDGGYTETYTYAYTYYIYDEMGRLRFVLPPKAVDHAKANSWTLTAAIIQELCFEYRYDAKGRQHSVHKPGEQGFTELVYDKTGRTIMRRSPLEAQQRVWEVILYDESDRVLQTGLLSSNATRATWQQNVNTAATVAAGNIGYYLWGAGRNTLPAVTVSGFAPQSTNYYDSYPATVLGSDNFSAVPITPSLVSAFNAEPYAQRSSTFGMLTATSVRTVKPVGSIHNDIQDWSHTKLFYDREGRNIYTIHQNASGGKDTMATQYDYTGKILASLKFTNINLGTAKNVKEWYRYTYEDYSGRLLNVMHRVGTSGAWHILEKNTYNELGQLVTKAYGTANAETQVYTYNIRGELTGINAEWALRGDKQGNNVSFGEALRYDFGFQVPRYDGNVSGVIWRGSSVSNPGCYAYNYDKAGRMLGGDFTKGAGLNSNGMPSSWSAGQMNFSEYAAYDKEGNITALRRHSMIAASTPQLVDRLNYTYAANSNKLQSVVDTNLTAYGLGEFVNGPAQGYSYDHSGNLTADASKGISTVIYTWFNKPQKVTFSNGNYIDYVYDAGGNKIREYIYESGAGKKLDYIGAVVLENAALQYISTPSGRTNIRTSATFEEYFVKDRLGNIRSIVRDQPGGASASSAPAEPVVYTAGYELPDAAIEEQLFEKVAEVRGDKPGSTQSQDTKSAKLEGQNAAVGTSIMIKVMAGDKVQVSADNYFAQVNNDTAVAEGGQLLEQVLGSMVTGAGGAGGGEAGTMNTTAAATQMNGALSAYESMREQGTDSTKPRSYLNYLYFDEQLQLLPEHSRIWQADGQGDWSRIGTDDQEYIPAPENGYIVVYLSNQSQEPVYYDNMVLSVTPGILLEERHYYPYGMPYGNWWSTAAGSLKNRQRYQGNEYREESGLRWMDFHNRQYDPQLGRFLGIDPLADDGGQQTLSPYHAMGCNPAMLTDPLGLKPALDMTSPNHGGGVAPIGYMVEGNWVTLMGAAMRMMGKGNSGNQLAQQMERGIAQSRIYNFINAALAGYGGVMNTGGATYYGASNGTSTGGERGTASGGVMHSGGGYNTTVSVEAGGSYEDDGTGTGKLIFTMGNVDAKLDESGNNGLDRYGLGLLQASGDFINNTLNGLFDMLNNGAQKTASGVVLISTGIVMPIINQSSVWYNEGFHPGAAYDSKNKVSWAVPYVVKDWKFVRRDDLMKRGNLSWEQSKEVIEATTSTLLLATPLKYNLAPNAPRIIQTGVNFGAGLGTKSAIKQGIHHLID